VIPTARIVRPSFDIPVLYCAGTIKHSASGQYPWLPSTLPSCSRRENRPRRSSGPCSPSPACCEVFARLHARLSPKCSSNITFCSRFENALLLFRRQAVTGKRTTETHPCSASTCHTPVAHSNYYTNHVMGSVQTRRPPFSLREQTGKARGLDEEAVAGTDVTRSPVRPGRSGRCRWFPRSGRRRRRSSSRRGAHGAGR